MNPESRTLVVCRSELVDGISSIGPETVAADLLDKHLVSGGVYKEILQSSNSPSDKASSLISAIIFSMRSNPGLQLRKFKAILSRHRRGDLVQLLEDRFGADLPNGSCEVQVKSRPTKAAVPPPPAAKPVGSLNKSASSLSPVPATPTPICSSVNSNVNPMPSVPPATTSTSTSPPVVSVSSTRTTADSPSLTTPTNPPEATGASSPPSTMPTKLSEASTASLSKPPEVNLSKPPDISSPKPLEVSLPKPPEVSSPKPPEVNSPKPPEVSSPKPPEISSPKPPEISSPKPPEVSSPKPPEVSSPKPPEVSSPKPPEVSLPLAMPISPPACTSTSEATTAISPLTTPTTSSPGVSTTSSSLATSSSPPETTCASNPLAVPSSSPRTTSLNIPASSSTAATTPRPSENMHKKSPPLQGDKFAGWLKQHGIGKHDVEILKQDVRLSVYLLYQADEELCKRLSKGTMAILRYGLKSELLRQFGAEICKNKPDVMTFPRRTSPAEIEKPEEQEEMQDSSEDLSELTADDLGDVFVAVKNACGKWYEIGLELRVDNAALAEIEETIKPLQSRLRETLRIWLLNGGQTRTWVFLANTMKSRLVGRLDVGDKILSGHC